MRATVRLFAGFILSLTFALAVYSQDDDPDIPKAPIPKLPTTGRRARDFAPRGWVVQMEANGDLNGDGRPDLAFVLHETDPKLVLHLKDFGTDNLDTNPRVLGIAFAQADGSYALAAQNSKLIPRWTESNMDDYFGDEGSLTVARGAFSVGLHYFANMGGWDAGQTTLTFRWQHGRFELIGYENDNLKRNTGVETKTSINFSTSVKIVNVDTIDDDRKGVPHLGTHQSRIALKPLRTLDNIGSGFEFEAP